MGASDHKLAGRVALVTGGGGAIGGAIARALDAAGATVAVADIRIDDARRTSDALARGQAVALDVTRGPAWNAAMADLVAQHGGIDILVNCAATHLQALVQDTRDEDWHRVVSTNVDSVFFGCRAAIPAMRERGRGSIVNIVTGQFGVAY
jgi:NAD(P)-dependent dehydrogenase (short-subunit alcohol dehydrogenase family)